MADFETHLRAGVSVHALCVASVAVGYFAGLVALRSLAAVTALLPVTVAGALFPDLDHPSSVPYRYGKRYLPLAVGAVAVGVGLRYVVVVSTPSVAATTGRRGGFLAGAIVASMGWCGLIGTRRLFPRLRPAHRTTTHRVPTGVVVALCVSAVTTLLLGGSSGHVTRELSVAAGATFLLGFLSHLGVDGVVARYWDRLWASRVDDEAG